MEFDPEGRTPSADHQPRLQHAGEVLIRASVV